MKVEISKSAERRLMQDEDEANRFAMELLMPYKMMMDDLKDVKYLDIESNSLVKKLAGKYQVSEQLMLMRILQLKKEGVLSG